MGQITLKTSTIFIAKGSRTRIFHSVHDVPPKLRKELEASTNGFNSATVLIADRKGKQQILKALNQLPNSVRERLAGSLENSPATRVAITRKKSVIGFAKRHWLELTLPVITALGVWALLNLR